MSKVKEGSREMEAIKEMAMGSTLIGFLTLLAGCATFQPVAMQDEFAAGPQWDDGLAEISYYDATDIIYGKPRKFVRVHLVNRQWMGADTGVKAEPVDPGAVPVFKFNISEEIPTENYNYRFLTTVFLERPSLAPFKVAASSQEWCGTTYKQLRWTAEGLNIQSMSYFGEEGDRISRLPADTVPYEALFMLARAVAADGATRTINLLAPVRGSHQASTAVTKVTLSRARSMRPVRVVAGRFEVKRIEVRGEGVRDWFDVEAAAPHRLIGFSAGDVKGRLLHVERRPYWDRNSASGFHEPMKAP